MVDANEFRVRILDDAVELIATLHLLMPLLDDEEFEKIIVISPEPAVKFLRDLLLRNVALVVYRLHDKVGSGPQGETASIAGWLGAIRNSSHRYLEDSEIECFQARLNTLTQDLEAKDSGYSQLKSLRHCELAHSIVPRSPGKPLSITFQAVAELAYETYELLIAIEDALSSGGSPKLVSLDAIFNEWHVRGPLFWLTKKHDESDP